MDPRMLENEKGRRITRGSRWRDSNGRSVCALFGRRIGFLSVSIRVQDAELRDLKRDPRPLRFPACFQGMVSIGALQFVQDG